MADEIKEIDSLDSLESFNSSNAVLIECSKKCDPYLVIATAAATVNKDREFRSVVEKCMALWLDDNKELYEVIKRQNSSDIAKQAMINIYEQDANIINKALSSICDEMKKYNNKEYFIETDKKKITYCSKNDPTYPTLLYLAEQTTIINFNHLSYENIIGFLNVHLSPDLYEKWKSNKTIVCSTEFTIPLYKDNLLCDLVDKINIQMDVLKNYIYYIQKPPAYPVFYIIDGIVYLTFDTMFDNVIKVTDLKKTIWDYTKFPIHNTTNRQTSTRIHLFKISK